VKETWKNNNEITKRQIGHDKLKFGKYYMKNMLCTNDTRIVEVFNDYFKNIRQNICEIITGIE